MHLRILGALVFIICLGPGSAGAWVVPGTPSPTVCDVAPLTDAYLYRLMEADYEPAGRHDPSGRAPDRDDVNAATETVLESVACTNANQPLAALALCTDRYILERFTGENGRDELGHLIAASSRSPQPAAPADRVAVDVVAPAIHYVDGRIGLLVTTSNAEEAWQDVVILAESDGRWLIDEVLLGDEAIRIATPADGG